MYRTAVCVVIAIFAVAWSGRTISAGVYNFAEPKVFSGDGPVSLRLIKFRANLIALQDIASAAGARQEDPDAPITGRDRKDESPLMRRGLLIKFLGSAAALRPSYALDLSGYLLWAGTPADVKLAQEILLRHAETYPENFFLQANLATAFFRKGEFGNAEDRQKNVLKGWPHDIADVKEPELLKFFDRVKWDTGDHVFYREAEEWFLKLIQARAKEPKGRYETVDALFTDKAGQPLRFVNEKGDYEPGKLAAAERAKLPKNYLEITQQLLLWNPNDVRLLWLYAELLAADDHIKHAQDIFRLIPKETSRIHEPAESVAHRKVLNALKAPEDAVDTTDPPPMGFDEFKKKVDLINPESPPYPWKHVALAFLIGFAVALFGYWQFRELRRRHQR